MCIQLIFVFEIFVKSKTGSNLKSVLLHSIFLSYLAVTLACAGVVLCVNLYHTTTFVHCKYALVCYQHCKQLYMYFKNARETVITVLSVIDFLFCFFVLFCKHSRYVFSCVCSESFDHLYLRLNGKINVGKGELGDAAN